MWRAPTESKNTSLRGSVRFVAVGGRRGVRNKEECALTRRKCAAVLLCASAEPGDSVQLRPAASSSFRSTRPEVGQRLQNKSRRWLR